MAACCKTCARRNDNPMMQVWTHPDVPAAGVGFCVIYPGDISTILVTPDDYVCSFYEPQETEAVD